MTKKNEPDPVRRLGLLWGSHTVAGRSGLTIKAIVTAAIDIADAEGAEALSMRKVAERLGVGTMSLYTHVPSKTELIDLMFDTVFGELYPTVDRPLEQGGWQAGLRFIAEQNWLLYRRHVWMLQITTGRPVLGPHASLKYEAELRPLDNLGLSDVEMDSVLTLVLTHVEGCARAQAVMDRTWQESGMTDAEWWVTQLPAMAQIGDWSRFPLASRVGASAGEAYQAASSPEHTFRFGLERILAGVAVLIEEKKASGLK